MRETWTILKLIHLKSLHMKEIFSKKLCLMLFLLSIGTAAFHQIQKNFNVEFSEFLEHKQTILDECEPAQNIQFHYEMNTSVAEVTWDGPTPQEGWYLVFSYENSIDMNWFLSDPNNFEQPEVRIIKTNSNSQYLYMNILHPGMYDLYAVSDCGNGQLVPAEKITFEMGERGNDEMGDCAVPTNFSAVQVEPRLMEFSWEPNDGEYYQIAWGPFGGEMNEGFFHDPQAGTIITNQNPIQVQMRQPGADDPKSFYMRKYCGGQMFSEWIVPGCAPPLEWNAQVNDSDITINWVPADGTNAWMLIYGPSGFDPNNPDSSVTYANIYDNPTHTIPMVSLEQGIEYEFYLRSVCFGSVESEWVGPGTFSTIFVPCEMVESIYSNHITHQSADIYWTGISGESQWMVSYSVAPFNQSQANHVTVNNPKAILMGLESSTTYEYIVTAICPSGQTTPSEIYSFTTVEDDEVYCIPYFLTGCFYDFIDHMILDGENDSRIYELNTGCTDSNYVNRTDLSVQLAPGNEYFTRVYKGNSSISGDNLAIWIDFDDNGIFEESERVGHGAMNAGGFTDINFTIPENANTGSHRMRVMLAFQAYSHMLSPCNTGENYSSNGEVHDYTVEILAIENCTTANAGQTIDNFMVCPKDDFTLISNGSSEVTNGLVRKWQSSPANQNNWTDIPNSSLPNTTIYGGITQATDYRYVVSCSVSGETSTSNVLKVSMSANCYCMPDSNCSGPGGLQINNVTLMGETILLDNTSGCSGNGYGDFRLEFPPDLEKGESYTLSVTANNANIMDDKIKAFIDFNRNNVFEPHEAIMDFPNGLPGTTVNNSFTIPTNINSGLYRMRVRIGWWMSAPITGCSALGWGETEDYLVEIIPGNYPDQCPVPANLNIQQGENPTIATASWSAGGSETQWELVYGEVGFNPENATPIAISTTPIYTMENLTPNTTYEFYVRAICGDELDSDWAGPKLFQTGTMGVSEIEFEGFSYYPVPVENKLNLKSMVNVEKLEIFNLSGQKLKGFNLNTKNSELDLSTLGAGIYVMKVQINGKVRTFKLIKK